MPSDICRAHRKNRARNAEICEVRDPVRTGALRPDYTIRSNWRYYRCSGELESVLADGK